MKGGKFQIKYIFIVILTIVLFVGCGKKESKDLFQSKKQTQQTQETKEAFVPDVKRVKIAELLKEPKSYAGQDVVVSGIFNGICCPSDFVLKDGIDAIEIYVTEMPSKSRVGSKMEIYGTVRVKCGFVSVIDKEVHPVRKPISNEQFFLLPTLTALENVELPALFSEFSKEKGKRAKELLELVGLFGRENHLPSQLSGGEMQRVAIAKSLINNPGILLADEPTGNLDSENAENIIEIFRKLNQTGFIVIMVTHNTEFAKMAKNIIYLKDGKIIKK